MSHNVLVTGGAGFIGGQVARLLVAAGHRVRVLDLDCTDAPAGCESVRGDVRSAADCDAAVAGVDAVCHQAATVGMGVDLQDLPRYASTNDLGTAELLAAMDRADVRRLVLASSMVVYGEGVYRCDEHGTVPAGPRQEADLAAGRFEPPCPVCGSPLAPGLVDEVAALDPRSVYAASKVAQEHLAQVWARLGGGTVAMLRYHNVYGPGLPRDTPYAGVAAIFRSALLSGQAPVVYEDGAQRRDFVHVRDVARANVAALDTQEGTVRAYNVASGTPHTILDLATELSRALGGPPPEVSGRYRLADVRHITADSGRIRRELDWSPEIGFQQGIAELAHDGIALARS